MSVGKLFGPLTATLAFVCGISGHAADAPLGVVTVVDDASLNAEMQAPHELEIDDMVALYGPGSLTKNPLTGQVTQEDRKFVGRAQVIGTNGQVLTLRPTWTAEGVTLASGFDVVPTPGEASPDGPPALVGQPLKSLSLPGGTYHSLAWNVADPEGGRLTGLWSVDNAASSTAGTIFTPVTGGLPATWLAPNIAGDYTVRATFLDQGGQETEYSQSISVAAVEDAPKSIGATVRLPTNTPAPHILERTDGGALWSVDANRRFLNKLGDDWAVQVALDAREHLQLREIAAITSVGKNLAITDGASVVIVDRNGSTKRRIDNLRNVVDLAAAPDGTLYAVEDGGTVQTFESDGRFRCQIGRVGENEGDFRAVSQITVDDAGTLYVFDLESSQVHRFNRQHRRLRSLNVAFSEDDPITDIKAYRNFLVTVSLQGTVEFISLENNKKEAFNTKKTNSPSIELEEARGLYVAGNGDVIVSWHRSQHLTHHTQGGSFVGLRGSDLNARTTRIFTSGQGETFMVSETVVNILSPTGWLKKTVALSEKVGGLIEDVGPIAINPQGTLIAAADLDKNFISLFDLKTDTTSRVGRRGKNNGELDEITALAMDAQNRIYVADEGTHAISIFRQDGEFLMRFGDYDRGRQNDEISEPALLAVAHDGSVCYIYDTDFYEVQKFTIDHQTSIASYVTNLGGRDSNDLGKFRSPVAMHVDRRGVLFVADGSRSDVQMFDFRGKVGRVLMRLEEGQLGVRPIGLGVHPDGPITVIDRNGELVSHYWK